MINTPDNVLPESTARCVIKVGHRDSNLADWYDADNPAMTVCDRHRWQYEERPDLGPFKWTEIQP